MDAVEREHALSTATERVICIFRIVGGAVGVLLTITDQVAHPPLERGIEIASLVGLAAVGLWTLLWLRTSPSPRALRRVMVATFAVDALVLLAQAPLHAFVLLEAPSPALLVPLLGAVRFGYRGAWVGIGGVAAAFVLRGALATGVYDGEIGIDPAAVTLLLAAMVGVITAHLYETARRGRALADASTAAAERAQRRTAAIHAVLADGVGGGVETVAERLATTVRQVLEAGAVRLMVEQPGGGVVECIDGPVDTGGERVVRDILYGTTRLGELEVVAARHLVDDLGEIADQLGLAVHAARLLDHEAAIAERYRALDAMRSDFVTLTSHELRTPVACVVGATETLLGLGIEVGEGPAKELLELVARQSNRLARLVEDLATIGRSDAGTLATEPRPTLVEDLVATVVLTVDELVRTGGPTNVAALVDPDHAVQVLVNIVENAFEHGVEPVEVTWSALDDRVRILVRDEGDPIAVEDAERVFERFVQLASMRHHSHGTGLGLPIGRDLARSMGGELWLDTGAATTTFVLDLPLVTPDRAGEGPRSDGAGMADGQIGSGDTAVGRRAAS